MLYFGELMSTKSIIMFRVINANAQVTIFRSRSRNRGQLSTTSALSYYSGVLGTATEQIMVKSE